MPKNKFQDVIFTIMMVIVMVYGMVVYNIALDKGGLDNETFLIALYELPIMGVVGFVLEMLIAGPLAKKLAFRHVVPGRDRMLVVILMISTMTVCMMCPLMSLAATILFKGVDAQVAAKWIQITVTNFPMALGLQIFIAGPLVRFFFGKMFPEKR